MKLLQKTSTRKSNSENPLGRKFGSIIFLSLTCLTACGGVSTEDATSECEGIRQRQASCFTDSAFDACVACYEDCGYDCGILESCPLQFSCE